MKFLKKIYRLTVWSHYEEDSDDPYTVDYNSMDEALNARYSYDQDILLNGCHAYSTCGPDIINLVELSNSELEKLTGLEDL